MSELQSDPIVLSGTSANGWDGWIRTSECRRQRPMPYRLATPQYWYSQRDSNPHFRLERPVSLPIRGREHGRVRMESNHQDAAMQGRDSCTFRSTPKLRAWAPIPVSDYHPVLWIRFVCPPTNSHRICSQLCCGNLRFLPTKRIMVGRAGVEPAEV